MSIDHATLYVKGAKVCADPIFVIGSPRSGTTARAEEDEPLAFIRLGVNASSSSRASGGSTRRATETVIE
jgi:hypothetical protein